jgi:hypothetical protein
LSPYISIRAKSHLVGTKAKMVATFIIEPEAVMRAIISLIAKTVIPRKPKFHIHYYAVSPQI